MLEILHLTSSLWLVLWDPSYSPALTQPSFMLDTQASSPSQLRVGLLCIMLPNLHRPMGE